MKSIDSIFAFYTGFGLAVLSTLLIGSGFIFKKRALLRSNTDTVRAGDGSLLYLRDWMWWFGLSLFGLGESANFVAYALAPAALVTPLGGLSVLVCAVLGARFLNERMNVVMKLGCFICLLGSTLVVLHAPKERSVNTLVEIEQHFFDRAFVAYSLFVLIFSCVLIFVFGPRLGRTNPLIYILISALLGSISVMACKGIGIALQDAIISDPSATVRSKFFWFLLGLLVCGLTVQLYYLNRALDLFNTGLVTALLYVFFTTFVLIASAILFREWTRLTMLDYVELIVGLILITTGVFMMTLLKDVEIILKNVANLYSLIHSSHRTAKYEDSTLPTLYRPHPRRRLKLNYSSSSEDVRGLLSSTNESLSPSVDAEAHQTAEPSVRFLLSNDACTLSDSTTTHQGSRFH